MGDLLQVIVAGAVEGDEFLLNETHHVVVDGDCLRLLGLIAISFFQLHRTL
jgi:hypothetical protein